MADATEKKEPEETKLSEKNIVYVGNKPPMSYVMAALSQLQQGTDKLVFKARGQAISRAVDAVEITRNRFMRDKLEVKDIIIGTEAVGVEGDMRNVSTIEISVEMKDQT
jgi:DNA-binding protein